MACAKCGGYYYCKCELLQVIEKIRIKKLELDSLELEKIKLEKKYAELEGDNYGYCSIRKLV
jgi:hypothetical protein